MEVQLIIGFCKCIQSCIDGRSMQLSNECQYFGLALMPASKAYDAIEDLLDMFKDDLTKNAAHPHINWYTLEKFEKYAHKARYTIGEMTAQSVKNHPKIPHQVNFQPCEKHLIVYQETINQLGNNLQCASSAALLAPQTFFLNLMPVVDNNKKCPLRHYIEVYYNPIHLPSNTVAQLTRQSKCVDPTQRDDRRDEIVTTALQENFQLLKSLNMSNKDVEKTFRNIELTATEIITNYLNSKRTVSRCT